VCPCKAVRGLSVRSQKSATATQLSLLHDPPFIGIELDISNSTALIVRFIFQHLAAAAAAGMCVRTPPSSALSWTSCIAQIKRSNFLVLLLLLLLLLQVRAC
jgi:hypothetical protein